MCWCEYLGLALARVQEQRASSLSRHVTRRWNWPITISFTNTRILELQSTSLFVVGWELVLYYHYFFFKEDEWFNWRFHAYTMVNLPPCSVLCGRCVCNKKYLPLRHTFSIVAGNYWMTNIMTVKCIDSLKKNYVKKKFLQNIVKTDTFCDFPSCHRLVSILDHVLSGLLHHAYGHDFYLYCVLYCAIIPVYQHTKKWSPNWHY